MLTWTIDHYQKKERRREVTIYLEGKLTSRDCAGIYKLCFDNQSRSDRLMLDLAQVEERNSSMPVLICCLRRTAGFAAGRISLRGIPNRPTGPATDFLDISQGKGCEFNEDCHGPASRVGYGTPPVGVLPGGTP